MVDLLLKLFEKLIELTKERQRINRAFHDDFVLPLMEQFEVVHNQYISSLQKYLGLVQKQSPIFDKNNSVFKEIHSDMIFTHSSREKLIAMSEGMEPFFKDHDLSHEPIDSLVRWLYMYMKGVPNSCGGTQWRNIARGTLMDALGKIAYEQESINGMNPQKLAENEVIKKIEVLQEIYKEAQHDYYKFKATLLN